MMGNLPKHREKIADNVMKQIAMQISESFLVLKWQLQRWIKLLITRHALIGSITSISEPTLPISSEDVLKARTLQISLRAV